MQDIEELYGDGKVKAKINGDRIECGKCGALLAKIHFDKPSIELLPPDEFRMIPNETMPKSLEIKCKHKDRGQYCNTVNEILL